MKYLSLSPIIILIIVINMTACNPNSKMENIKFIPESFHHIKLDINNNEEHLLTPFYPNFDVINKIGISIPQQVIIKNILLDSICIPLCGYSHITSRRSLKYHEQNKLLVHIKKKGDEHWQIGEIIELPLNEHPSNPSWMDKMEEQKKKRIEKATKLLDSELDQGGGVGSAFNVNLLKYVAITLETGKYDVFVTLCGLESNHVQIEIMTE